MSVYKKFTAQDFALVPFNAHKQYDFVSSSASENKVNHYTSRWTSESISLYSSASTNPDGLFDPINTIKYNQIDHLFYKNFKTSHANRFDKFNYLEQRRDLYERANILSIPSGLYGHEIKPNSLYISSAKHDVVDDGKGHLIISGTNINDYPLDVRSNIFRLDPIKGFKAYDLTVYPDYAIKLKDPQGQPYEVIKQFYRQGTVNPNALSTINTQNGTFTVADNMYTTPTASFDIDDSYFFNGLKYHNVQFSTSSVGSLEIIQSRFSSLNFNSQTGSFIVSPDDTKYDFNKEDNFAISFYMRPKSTNEVDPQIGDAFGGGIVFALEDSGQVDSDGNVINYAYIVYPEIQSISSQEENTSTFSTVPAIGNGGIPSNNPIDTGYNHYSFRNTSFIKSKENVFNRPSNFDENSTGDVDVDDDGNPVYENIDSGSFLNTIGSTTDINEIFDLDFYNGDGDWNDEDPLNDELNQTLNLPTVHTAFQESEVYTLASGSTKLGSGNTNTNLWKFNTIFTGNGTQGLNLLPVIKSIDESTAGGYEDWWLPSYDEMNEINKSLGTLSPNGESSWLSDPNNALLTTFNNQTQGHIQYNFFRLTIENDPFTFDIESGGQGYNNSTSGNNILASCILHSEFDHIELINNNTEPNPTFEDDVVVDKPSNVMVRYSCNSSGQITNVELDISETINKQILSYQTFGGTTDPETNLPDNLLREISLFDQLKIIGNVGFEGEGDCIIRINGGMCNYNPSSTIDTTEVNVGEYTEDFGEGGFLENNKDLGINFGILDGTENMSNLFNGGLSNGNHLVYYTSNARLKTGTSDATEILIVPSVVNSEINFNFLDSYTVPSITKYLASLIGANLDRSTGGFGEITPNGNLPYYPMPIDFQNKTPEIVSITIVPILDFARGGDGPINLPPITYDYDETSFQVSYDEYPAIFTIEDGIVTVSEGQTLGGEGYFAPSGSTSFDDAVQGVITNVPTTTTTGDGEGLTLDIIVTAQDVFGSQGPGEIVQATVNESCLPFCNDYQVGDIIQLPGNTVAPTALGIIANQLDPGNTNSFNISFTISSIDQPNDTSPAAFLMVRRELLIPEMDDKKRYIISKSTTKTTIPPTTTTRAGKGSAVLNTNVEGNLQIKNINSEVQFPFEIYMSGSEIFFDRSDGDQRISVSGFTTGSIGQTHNTSFHILCQNSSSIMEVYINGHLATSSIDLTKKSTQNRANLYIGAKGNKSETESTNFKTDKFFNGELSNINIYDKSFNATSSNGSLPIQLMSESINNSPYIGNIFYQNGFITVTHPKYQEILGNYTVEDMVVEESFTVDSEGEFGISVLQFQGSHLIYEHEYQCTVDEHEFNDTLNITARKIPSTANYEVANFTTSSLFKPYVTTIGLYNDNGELLVVGKLGQPIRTSNETDTTFILRWDS